MDSAFADLRRLSDLLLGQVVLRTAQRDRLIHQLAQKLGSVAIPLLGRVLRSANPAAREGARTALALLASELHTRTRVIAELRGLLGDGTTDDAKVCALGLLAELGEHSAAKLEDPAGIQRRSALALASQLETPGDVANAADMMVRQLAPGDVVQMLEVLAEVAPPAAHRLGSELALRLDLEADPRAKIAALVAGTPPAAEPSMRPTHVAVLVDEDGRMIVVATAKVNGERRWRRWAVLIGESGLIDDCVHEDQTARDTTVDPTASLVSNICADGYRVASSELDHARTLVATAARRTTRASRDLGSSYYLGRDLLDLRDAHVVAAAPQPTAAPLERAVDLLASGDLAAARVLLESCDPSSGDVWISEWAGALGACLLAQGDAAGAVGYLERAIAAEPWPLHYWNLAAALHAIGDVRGCQQALRRFVATSAVPSGLADDPEQPSRLAHADKMIAELARIAKLDRRRPRRARAAEAQRRRKKR